MSLGKIGATLDLPETTVQYTLQNDLERESGTSVKHVGQPRITIAEQDKALVTYVKSHPDAIYGHLKADLCPWASLSTIKHRLHKENLRK